MIYSVRIINRAGLNLIEHRYAEPSDDEYDPNLVSGMLSALSQFCEQLTQDEIQTITLGNSQFFLLKHMDLLFTIHTDLSHSKYLSLAKLQRIKMSFTEQYPKSDLFHKNKWVFQDYIPILDEILREQTVIELEIIIDYFLTGKGIVGTHIRDIKKNAVVLTRSPPELLPKLTEYTNLIQNYFDYTERSLHQLNSTEKYVIFQEGNSWLVGIEQESILLVALFQDELDHNIVMDIIHGTLGDVMQFIAKYFQDTFGWVKSSSTALIIGDSLESSNLARLLESDDFSIVQTPTSETALATILTKSPQLVIYDLENPSDTKIFFDKIEKHKQHLTIPIILLRPEKGAPDIPVHPKFPAFNIFKPVRREHINWIKQHVLSFQ